MVVVAVAWRQIYAPDGPLNQLLRPSGSTASRAAWLGDYIFALPAVGLIGTWVSTGLVIVLLLAGHGRDPARALRGGPPRRRGAGAGVLRHHAARRPRRDRGRPDAHGHRRAEDLRPRLRDDQRRPRHADHRAVATRCTATPSSSARSARPPPLGVCLTAIIFVVTVVDQPARRTGRRLIVISTHRAPANYVILVAFALFALYPVLLILVAALRPDQLGASGGLHFGNFAEAWDEGRFGTYLRTSVRGGGLRGGGRATSVRPRRLRASARCASGGPRRSSTSCCSAS